MILFDEIEKAHPDVFNMLLQISTTAGSPTGRAARRLQQHADHHDLEHRLAAHPGDGRARVRADEALVTEELRRAFRPEFLNRVDETVIFHGLGREHLRRIVEIQVGLLLKRLEERKITLELTEARGPPGRVGYDPPTARGR